MQSRFTWRRFAVAALVLTFALSFASQAVADELYARIRGTITDHSGAVVPGVPLKATNLATGVVRQTTTNNQGYYEFLNLPPGTYTLAASKEGFQTATTSNIALEANQVYLNDISLKVGSATDTITVEANAAQVEQASMQLTATITENSILNLPLNGRNWVTLQLTLPGVVNADTRFGTNFSTNGSQAQQNSYLLNGTDYNDLPLNTPLVAPSPDSIAEVRMVTNTINPEYGRNSGAILNAISKSGTNRFHGSAFDFYRDTFLNTKNFFQTTPSVFHQNQFGGTIGGPVLKNNTFFFFSFQGTRNRQAQAFSVPTVFTNAQRNGDFSALASKISATRVSPFPLLGENGVVFPAGTPWKTLFPTGHVPVSDFNPLSVQLVNQFVPPPNLGADKFTFNPVSPTKINQYIGRFDHTFSQKDAVWFYALANNNQQTSTLPFTGATLPGFGDQSTSYTKNFTTSWNHTFTTSALNELRLGYTRLNFNTVVPQNPVLPSAVGFPNITPQLASGAGMPRLAITGYFTLGFSTNGPQPRKDQTYQLTDNFSWIKGRHALKFGYEGRRFDVWNPFSARNNGSYTFNNSALYGTGDPGLNFLLGIPTNYDQTAGGLIIARAYEHYLYAQDQWRVRDSLTLTMGMGYQIDNPIAELANNGLSRICFVPGEQSRIFPSAPTGLVYPGDPGCNKSGGATTKLSHFGPRVGFAYSPSLGWLSGGQGKMSIRGGVGIYYNRSEEELSLQDLGSPPFGLDSGGIATLSTKNDPRIPSFPDPWRNIASVPPTSVVPGVMTNPFPFVPPAPGASPDFTPLEPFSLNTLDAGATIPYAINYNLTVERELAAQTILRVGYVGSKGYNLITSYDRNPTTPEGVAACLTDPACFNDPGNQMKNFPSHYQFPGNIFGGIGWQRNKGYSNYNALQINLDKHLSHGLQLQTAYTWSHALDVSSSFEDVAFLSGGNVDPYGRLARDYGNSAFDTRHRWVVSFSYDIPNLNKISGLSWLPSPIFGGWRFTGINALQTGQPVVLQDSNQLSLTCNDKTFYACADRPDLVKNPIALDPRTATFGGKSNYFFDPGSFTDNALGTLGTASRNFLHGPGYWNADVSMQKDTQLAKGETPKVLQLRLDAFNVFNHTNFANPTGDVASSNFGRVSSLVRNSNPRLVQLGAKFIF